MRNILRQGLAALSILILGLAMGAAVSAMGAETNSSVAQLIPLITQELARQLPGARIELLPEMQIQQGALPAMPDSVSVLQDNARGVQLSVVGRDSEGATQNCVLWMRYRALQPAWVATRRVLPGERLTSDALAIQEVDVSQGLARQNRGLILPANSDINKLEARQTILEGQFALSSGVQRVPDIRRGDAIQIRLISGDVILSTSGTAEEPAYFNDQVRVLTAKSKKSLLGRLTSDKTVEVRL